MPKNDPDRASEASASRREVKSRIDGAYFLGGTWYAADGSLLTPVEVQKAHRAADKAAAEARAKALLGGE